MFKGSFKSMASSFLGGDVSKAEIDEVQDMIATWVAEKNKGRGNGLG
jgi:hypothetical protein